MFRGGKRLPELLLWASRSSVARTVFACVLLAVFLSAPASAQPPEENPPPPRTGQQLVSLPGGTQVPSLKTASRDALGPNVSGIVFLTQPQQVHAGGLRRTGLDFGTVALLQMFEPAARFQRFLGVAISEHLLIDLHTEIVKYYREMGHALVAVLIPPQDVTTGTIQVVVAEFHLAGKRLEGNQWTPDAHVLGNISAETGERIDTRQLIEDLNWLNLNPYRNMAAVFEPGKRFGETNLILRSNEQRPWSVYAGYSNYGTRSTDENRLFAGVHIANLPVLDHQISYQATLSPDAFASRDTIAEPRTPSYHAHDGIYFAPLPWRHKLYVRGAWIQSNSVPVAPFDQRSTTAIVSGRYAVPVPQLGDIRAELYGIVEYKDAERKLFFNAVEVSDLDMTIFQFGGGVTVAVSDPLGKTSVDGRLVYSPGNVGPQNTNARVAAFNANPGADAEYLFFYGSAERHTPLFQDISIETLVGGQWTDEDVPSTEDLAIGGPYTVRGYAVQDASGDVGIFAQSELVWDLSAEFQKHGQDLIKAFTIFGFFDAGWIDDLATGVEAELYGTGGGLRANLGEAIAVEAHLGVALENGILTRKGNLEGRVRVTVHY